jgi:ribosomal protein S18 acetylase RimI-like enzyme
MPDTHDSRAARLFAAYAPDASRGARVPDAELVIRTAESRDARRLGHIQAQRQGSDPDDAATAFERRLGAPAPAELLLVASVHGDVVAYGRAVRFTPPVEAPSNVIPEGWYLMGLLVDPPFRRRGIGERLTRARLDWLRARAPRCFYYASALNRASIDLHQRLGFEELTRDFWAPDTTFTGGVGVLFRLEFAETSAPP